MEIKQLTPAEIKRDDCGQWIHPELAKYWDDNFGNDVEQVSKEQWNELKRYFNIETINIFLESSVSSDDWEKMMDDCDISKWHPIAPHGFFLIDTHFTEDDAVALFAREIRPESEVA